MATLLGGDLVSRAREPLVKDRRASFVNGALHYELQLTQIDMAEAEHLPPTIPHTYFPSHPHCRVTLYQDAHQEPDSVPPVPLVACHDMPHASELELCASLTRCESFAASDATAATAASGDRSWGRGGSGSSSDSLSSADSADELLEFLRTGDSCGGNTLSRRGSVLPAPVVAPAAAAGGGEPREAAMRAGAPRSLRSITAEGGASRTLRVSAREAAAAAAEGSHGLRGAPELLRSAASSGAAPRHSAHEPPALESAVSAPVDTDAAGAPAAGAPRRLLPRMPAPWSRLSTHGRRGSHLAQLRSAASGVFRGAGGGAAAAAAAPSAGGGHAPELCRSSSSADGQSPAAHKRRADGPAFEVRVVLAGES